MDVKWEEVFDQCFCERISTACLNKFKGLGKNGKPVGKEWTVLACVVKSEAKGAKFDLEVVALGTGSKCLGGSELPRSGDRLHDSHAEIIARRAFKLYLMDQLKSILEDGKSVFVLGEEGFKVRSDVAFHFYCSNVPCGDASIFPKEPEEEQPRKRMKIDPESPLNFVLTKEDPLKIDPPLKNNPPLKKSSLAEDPPLAEEPLLMKVPLRSETGDVSEPLPDIHRTGAKCAGREVADPKENGLNYHVTGVLRTKPGRGDPTLSHCCSDKMFKWTVQGVQGGLIMPFLERPLYLQTITIGAGPFNHEAMHRALHTRFKKGLHGIKPPFAVHVPFIRRSGSEFPHAKPCDEDVKCKPSAASIIWSDTARHKGKAEVSVDGKRLGTTKKNENLPKSRVSICRIELLRRAFEVVAKTRERISSCSLTSPRFKELANIDVSTSYEQFKSKYSPYQSVWKCLQDSVLVNWTKKTVGFKDFALD
ncbi:UNVERIFIED_CONTAM: hypothetical protein GTU68_007154 [Idotea baltica]|nr:hypothetical protein [Idotea baltica]MCL4129008.1 hypothetical protein [Idotea baltica]MCL4129009.1 hypothetical protein [Idotea baltica]